MNDVVTAKDYGLLIAQRMDDVPEPMLHIWMPTFSAADHDGYTLSVGVIGSDFDADMVAQLVRVIRDDRPHILTLAASGYATDTKVPNDGSPPTQIREWEAFSVVAITADEVATYMRTVERISDGAVRFIGEWEPQDGTFTAPWVSAVQDALRQVRDAVVGRRDN